MLCGKSGHGAADCRTRAVEENQPPAKKNPPPPEPPVPSRDAVFVPGFGCKGVGKDANYGVAIAPPSVPSAEELPVELQRPSSSSGAFEVDLLPEPSLPPDPIAATSEEVEEWMRSSFRPITNLDTNDRSFPPEVGDNILWRGVKTGPHGQPSTKCEYFNAKVRHRAFDKDGLWFYVD